VEGFGLASFGGEQRNRAGKAWHESEEQSMVKKSRNSKARSRETERRQAQHVKRYSWSFKGQRFDVDPEVAAQEFDRIRKTYGYLKPDTLIEAARNEDHPLHSVFPWDDEEAARIGREHVASYLIRSLRVTVEVIPGQVITTRGAVLTRDVYAPSERSYQDIIQTMSEPDGRAFVLRQAWLQLAAWKRKYAGLSELADALPLIEEAMKKFAS
jgi:hypothetical protein